MKYPNHLILDIQVKLKPDVANQYTSLVAHSIWQTNMLKKFRLFNNKNHYKFQEYLKGQVSYTTKLGEINQTKNLQKNTSFTLSLFDIHFIRKERLYTKLKYSRCPQYDIVSGGFAAIFAGFVGFLISEKFGIELVDSGDFYNAFMYGVFGVFFSRLLIRLYSKDETLYHPLSLKHLMLFYRDLLTLVLKWLTATYLTVVRFLQSFR